MNKVPQIDSSSPQFPFSFSFPTLNAIQASVFSFVSILVFSAPFFPLRQQNIGDKVDPALSTLFSGHDLVSVTVALTSPDADKTDLGELRAEITAVQNRVLSELDETAYRVRTELNLTPMLALDVSEDTLIALAEHPDVIRIDVDNGGEGLLSSTVPLVGADIMHSYGFTGEGVVVAVLDTGVDTDHPDLQDDIIHQACFLDNDGAIDGRGQCPNGSDRQFGVGAAEDNSTVSHGTFIAGVISSAGNNASVGVAPDAQIVAIKIMNSSTSYEYDSEIIAALEYILTDLPEVNLINMSFYSDIYTGVCDTADAAMISYATVLDTLRANGVLSFAATGNDFSSTQIGGPACIDSVIAVAASEVRSNGAEAIRGAGNRNGQTDVLAPGAHMSGPMRNGKVGTLYGTSVATPHVAGCAALLMEYGVTSPDEIEAFLTSSSVQIYDYGSKQTFPRLDCVIQRSFVDVDATGAGNGDSWSDAYTNLQDALTAAAPYTEIWVAEGTYYPDIGLGIAADDAQETFVVSDQVKIYGGFVGTETVRLERKPETYITILSGDIDGNDTNIDGNSIAETMGDIQGDNAYHVVSTNGIGTSVLDGLVITAGQADSNSVANGGLGGGLLAYDGLQLTIQDVLFSGNVANHGGAIYCSGDISLSAVQFSGNWAVSDGGAIYGACNVTAETTEFHDNQAQNDGGALYLNTSGAGQFNNVQFLDNQAVDGGGAVAFAGNVVSFSDATFTNNTVTSYGGTIEAGTDTIITLNGNVVADLTGESEKDLEIFQFQLTSGGE